MPTVREHRVSGARVPDRVVHDLAGAQAQAVGSFYTYGGSLTTPACTEGVRWFVLEDGGHASPAAVRRFHFVISRFPHYGGYPNNNRPVQPLHGRVISFRA